MALQEAQGSAVSGVIYFVRAKGLDYIKIGFSKNLDKRLRVLQASSPVPLELIKYVRGTMSTEQALLHVFGKYRVHGEWFKVNPSLSEFIKALVHKQKFEAHEIFRLAK